MGSAPRILTEPVVGSAGIAAFDADAVRAQFPALTTADGHRLHYLDSAASTLKPKPVIDALAHFYLHDYANIHRGLYDLSARATTAYENARQRIATFLGAASDSEIVFVRGATEAMNLVAQTYGRAHLRAGQAVVITAMEHHANIVPWQLIRDETGIELIVVPMDDDGVLDMDAYRAALKDHDVGLVSVVWVSNALGTVNPAAEITALAHEHGAVVMLDGAQAAPHLPVDVQALDCDFFAFSGHKLYAPSGIGILYGKRALLDTMPPYQGGGDMIQNVTFAESKYEEPPARFEAGTPHIAGAVGLAAAMDWLDELGRPAVEAHEANLLAYAREQLQTVSGLRLIGNAPHQAGAQSFVMDAAHPADIATILDRVHVAVRTGHHCAQPAQDRMGVTGTARASFGVYNTKDDIDALVAGLTKVNRIFG